MTRVLVCGGRDYNDVQHIDAVLERLWETEWIGKPLVLIHGAATGVDELAATWAFDVAQDGHDVKIEPYPVSREMWRDRGLAAGPMRNHAMIVKGKPDVCIAFPGGRGTSNCVEQCRLHGVPVRFAKAGSVEVSP